MEGGRVRCAQLGYGVVQLRHLACGSGNGLPTRVQPKCGEIFVTESQLKNISGIIISSGSVFSKAITVIARAVNQISNRLQRANDITLGFTE